MSEDKKKSFVLYYDYKQHINMLPDGEAGKLFKALLNEFGPKEIKELSPAAQMAFSFIFSQVERDGAKYQKLCEKRREAGKKGGETKARNARQNLANVANAKIAKHCLPNVADNENETETENDKDLINKGIVGKEPTTPPYKIIIEYLNQKTGSHYRHSTKSTQRAINARLQEGFTIEDFKRVIDTKAAQWLGDEKMSAFLRPETLFAPSHFESYLNETRQRTPANEKYSGMGDRLAAETEKNLQIADLGDYDEFL